MSDLTRLNPTPHAIAMYASQPLSPVATQHSLPSRTLPFTWAGLSPAGSHQLCLAHSLDHLVGPAEQRDRKREAECLGSLEIDDHLDLAGLLDRQLARLLALEDAPGIGARQAIGVGGAAAVAHEPARGGELAALIDRGHTVTRGERAELSAPAR